MKIKIIFIIMFVSFISLSTPGIANTLESAQAKKSNEGLFFAFFIPSKPEESTKKEWN